MCARLERRDTVRIVSQNCDDILRSTKNGGNSKPVMYTELHQDGSLSLFFNSLQEEQAGKYACRGTYARNMHMNKSVTIDTISEYKNSDCKSDSGD